MVHQDCGSFTADLKDMLQRAWSLIIVWMVLHAILILPVLLFILIELVARNL